MMIIIVIKATIYYEHHQITDYYSSTPFGTAKAGLLLLKLHLVGLPQLKEA